ncbi:hypothetical protein ACLMJK_000162 [Lecanora helva]
MLPLSNRPVQGAIFVLLIILLLFSLNSLYNARANRGILGHHAGAPSYYGGLKVNGGKTARRVYPAELLQRPLPRDLTSIPKLLHQSWINETIPTKFEEWSESCREVNSDWEWVLWTDEDNLKLVEKYAPWFNLTYEFLRSEIYRADAARNIYMHIFGGVYADLDTECLLPYETMFEKHDTSAVLYSDSSFIDSKGERKAFFGRMGMDDDSMHSIPNAFMASTPGHPFWLLPIETADEMATLAGMQPERLTGPIALRDQILNYQEHYDAGQGDGGIKLDEQYAKSGWRHLYRPSSVKGVARVPQSIVILPHFEVFPFSWQRDGDMFKDFCIASAETFDSGKCKELMALDHWGSHSITYWSHSWGANGEGHWDDHLEAISKSNDKQVEAAGRQKIKGDGNVQESHDAAEAAKKVEDWRKKLDEADQNGERPAGNTSIEHRVER